VHGDVAILDKPTRPERLLAAIRGLIDQRQTVATGGTQG
jgi:hypothetical protein